MTTIAPLQRGLRAARRAPSPWREAYNVATRAPGVTGAVLQAALSAARLPRAPSEGASERARLLQRVARALCDVHAIALRLIGALPEPPFVLVANHVSYLDPLLLAALTPCTAIAKRELGAWPVVGARVRELGVLLVDRASPHSGARALRGALRALDRGIPVLNFPEGTTTRGDVLLPFRRGIFGAARIAGAPIVPAAVSLDPPELCWVGDDAFLPHYLALSGRSDAAATIVLGAPIPPDRSPAELAACARDAILNLLF